MRELTLISKSGKKFVFELNENTLFHSRLSKNRIFFAELERKVSRTNSFFHTPELINYFRKVDDEQIVEFIYSVDENIVAQGNTVKNLTYYLQETRLTNPERDMEITEYFRIWLEEAP